MTYRNSNHIARLICGAYDKSKLRFDHHQNGFTETFLNSTVPLAAVGLIWRDFGQQILTQEMPNASQDELQFSHQFIYFGFFQAIDGGDNGVDEVDGGTRAYSSNTTLPARVHRLNYIGDFNKACELCETEFRDYL